MSGSLDQNLAHLRGAGETVAINSSNMYLDLNDQGKGSLKNAKDVDSDLVKKKVERLLYFSEAMSRSVDTSSEGTLFSAGEINASPVILRVLRTQLSPYIQESFLKATCIPYITVYRVDIMNGKYTITETIKYTNCFILHFSSRVDSVGKEQNTNKLNEIEFSFRYEGREDTLKYFDQTGKAEGNKKTKMNFITGQLEDN